MSDQFDTDYTYEIVCPHCGYEYGDSWEFSKNGENGRDECDECGKPFRWYCDISVRYSTTRIEGGQDDT